MQATLRTIPGNQLPTALREISDPPEQLYVRGALPSERPVAIVGSRRTTAYGRRVAGTLAARLAASGVPIVSGLAFGVDTCAHRAALDSGGRTIAVLPGGVDRESISPRTNLAVADRIVEQGGALLSELPAGTAPRKHYYTSRNRLISGLARAVVVVEAALPSGSLVTAQHAADQGRELWAVPGPIDSPTSAGTNRLIRDGANPLVSVEEFLEALGIETKPAQATGLLATFPDSPQHVNELSDRLNRPISELETELTKLELRGLVRKQNDGTYVRT